MSAHGFCDPWQDLWRVLLIHLEVVIYAFEARIPNVNAKLLDLSDKTLDLRA